jgi:hypothetical protein
MSTEDINKVVVTLKKGVDVDAFMEEMSSVGNTTPFVPNRAVELYNEKPESLRNVDYVMTREEAELLQQDPRVEATRYGTKKENNIERTLFTTGPSLPYVQSNTWTTGNIDLNWGMLQSSFTTNMYPTGTTSRTWARPYVLTGSGVDFVIQDSGLQVNHPEFTDALGISRVQQVNWFTLTGTSGTMPVNFYTDVVGHGTHVCSSAVGKTYGWSPNATIYVMNILGGNADSSISDTLSFNLLRIWHTNKSITSTGYKRPTVVNMSWGYSFGTSFVNSGVYRGTNWTSSDANVKASYGVVSPNGLNSRTPVYVASVMADVEDCLDAGVILIGAAGNESYKIDVPNGLDYDNTVQGGNYYMRGPSPSSTTENRIVRVGSISVGEVAGIPVKSTFSNTGPGVKMYAPGEVIAGAVSNTTQYAGSVNYPYNSAFKSIKIAGTSMATPQVSGIVCNLLEARPWYNHERIQNYLYDNSTKNFLNDTSPNSYTNYTSLQGSPNQSLYNPVTEGGNTFSALSGSFPTVIEHTVPARAEDSPEYTAELHGKF